MLKKYGWIVLLGALALVLWFGQQTGSGNAGRAIPASGSAQTEATEIPAQAPPPSGNDAPGAAGLPDYLPDEAKATLALIASDGPFPYRQDGAIFQNREKRLPQKARGYYREYTVETPGLSHRGARRIVTAGNPAHTYYYTDDHYDSFREFKVQP